ncbi:MAG: L-threonylcarbamoyladenylate synthase [Candidatus Methylomirabilia bacterium]
MSPTRVRPVDPSNPEASALQEAAGLLRRGGLVAFPTETFYGLGAHAMDGLAVGRVYQVKGRPESKPLLVLVDSVTMVESLALEVPELARRLMAAHWPGPLTLVFKARPDLPSELTAGTGTIGIRMPGHPVALGLVRVFALAVTAPSANLSGSAPPTAAEGVKAQLDGMIDLILDGGETRGGQPSTIVDVSVAAPRIIRRGAVDLSLAQ